MESPSLNGEQALIDSKDLISIPTKHELRFAG